MRPSQGPDVEDRSDLLGREAETSRSPDEYQHSLVLVVIQAVPSLAPSGNRKHSDPLEIADRFRIHAGKAGQLASSDAPNSLRLPRHVDFP